MVLNGPLDSDDVANIVRSLQLNHEVGRMRLACFLVTHSPGRLLKRQQVVDFLNACYHGAAKGHTSAFNYGAVSLDVEGRDSATTQRNYGVRSPLWRPKTGFLSVTEEGVKRAWEAQGKILAGIHRRRGDEYVASTRRQKGGLQKHPTAPFWHDFSQRYPRCVVCTDCVAHDGLAEACWEERNGIVTPAVKAALIDMVAAFPTPAHYSVVLGF